MSSESEQYAEAILNGWPLDEVPVELCAKIMKELNKIKNQSLIEQDYRRVQFIENRMKEFDQIASESRYNQTNVTEMQKLNDKLETTRSDLNRTVTRNDQIFQRFSEEYQKAMAALAEEQARELEKFDQEHATDPPARFRKFSKDYSDIRMREERMVASKRYVEANELRAEADKMEKAEKRQQKLNWERYIEQQKAKLVKKHANAKRCAIEKWQKDWNALIVSAQNEESIHRNAVGVVESQIRIQNEKSDALPKLQNNTSAAAGRTSRFRRSEYMKHVKLRSVPNSRRYLHA